MTTYGRVSEAQTVANESTHARLSRAKPPATSADRRRQRLTGSVRIDPPLLPGGRLDPVLVVGDTGRGWRRGGFDLHDAGPVSLEVPDHADSRGRAQHTCSPERDGWPEQHRAVDHDMCGSELLIVRQRCAACRNRMHGAGARRSQMIGPRRDSARASQTRYPSSAEPPCDTMTPA